MDAYSPCDARANGFVNIYFHGKINAWCLVLIQKLDDTRNKQNTSLTGVPQRTYLVAGTSWERLAKHIDDEAQNISDFPRLLRHWQDKILSRLQLFRSYPKSQPLLLDSALIRLA